MRRDKSADVAMLLRILLLALLLTAEFATPSRAANELRREPVPLEQIGMVGPGDCGSWTPWIVEGEPFTVSAITRITALGGWVSPHFDYFAGTDNCCLKGPWSYALEERGPSGTTPRIVARTTTFGPLPCTAANGVELVNRPTTSWCQGTGLVYRSRSIVGGCALLRPPPYSYQFLYLGQYLLLPDGSIDRGCNGTRHGTTDQGNEDPIDWYPRNYAAYNVIASPCSNCETCCDDGVDNDSDGLTDCADPDCAGSYHGCLPENLAGNPDDDALCANQWDDDSDGLIDCDDPDCWLEDACTGPEECDDGRDNDHDGLTDCSDPDCIGLPECPEDCANGVDDDLDLLTDCDDDDCADSPECLEDCGDGVDNDENGLIDCHDIESCIDDPACSDFEYAYGGTCRA